MPITPHDSINLSTLSTLPAQHKAALERGGIHTVAQLLFTSPQDVARKCRISPIEFKAIIDIVCRERGDFRLHYLDDIKSEGDEMFSTGDVDIDLALGGGVRTGMVWEIVGESASGKTQLALQLSLFVQIAPDVGGIDGSCCYLTTSSKLPTRRLLQILQNRKVLSSSSCSLDNVHTIATPSTSALLHVLSQTLEGFIQQQNQTTGVKPVKLIVIDALAELFHDMEKTTTATLVERSRKVAEISTILHALAAEYRIAIVVLNEVIDVFDKGNRYSDDKMELLYSEQSRWFSRGDSVRGEDRKEASLGLAWANQVNARIFLSRTGRRRYLGETVDRELKMQKTGSVEESVSNTPSGPQAQDDEQSTLIRRFNVIFSSVSPPVSLDYIVTENGVSALQGTITYPSTPSEFLTLEDSASMVDQQQRSHQIAPLDVGVIEDHNVGINDLPTISHDGPLPGLEDEWDQYWENEEIPADLDLSIPDIT
ncbi:hypothetical protein APHAL10511_007032 [Amanita phalloides]|nr:hypothetical protein APHAL10511_007032 [Amanita phalloides]